MVALLETTSNHLRVNCYSYIRDNFLFLDCCASIHDLGSKVASPSSTKHCLCVLWRSWRALSRSLSALRHPKTQQLNNFRNRPFCAFYRCFDRIKSRLHTILHETLGSNLSLRCCLSMLALNPDFCSQRPHSNADIPFSRLV